MKAIMFMMVVLMAVLTGCPASDYCEANPTDERCVQWCDQHPDHPSCVDGPMCSDIGEACGDVEEDPNAVACCVEDETAGCFRGTCTEATVNPPGCVQQGDPCTPGVDTCCSAGRFDPLGVCEDPFGEGNVCVPPA